MNEKDKLVNICDISINNDMNEIEKMKEFLFKISDYQNFMVDDIRVTVNFTGEYTLKEQIENYINAL